MRSKMLVSGFDGVNHYEVNDLIDGPTDYHREMLANGLVEPQDEAARQFAAAPARVKGRYVRPELQSLSKERHQPQRVAKSRRK